MARTFELGLTMAGAVSAGAYTGGVVDVLIGALDAYHDAKGKPDWDGPDHDVVIPVLSGASAGAITSAVAAIQFASRIEHVDGAADRTPEGRLNRLYDSWVRQIDVSKLLGTEDLRGGRVLSLLDSSSLMEIGLGSLETELLAAKRPWVGDAMAVYLTVANLRGVPYGFELFGEQAQLHGMTNHMDAMRFLVSFAGASRNGFVALDPKKAPGDGWDGLVAAAIASGAFPIGLQARLLRRSPRDYYDPADFRAPVEVFRSAADPYEFLCVDGGLMNNEPLELARRHLSGGRDQHNPRKGDEATRAVVMIDPFPNAAEYDPKWAPDDRLTRVALRMFGALKSQARFKPEELMLAEQADVYSRFVISPARRTAEGKRAELDIAAGIMGGFGGFLHETFRRHDYLLGMRNCQHFLRRHLVLPETNGLFADVPEERRAAWCVKDGQSRPRMVTDSKGRTVRALPVIPLASAVAQEIPRPAAPVRTVVDLGDLKVKIKARFKKLGLTLADSEMKALAGPFVRFLGKNLFLPGAVKTATNKAVGWIDTELDRLAGLDRPQA